MNPCPAQGSLPTCRRSGPGRVRRHWWADRGCVEPRAEHGAGLLLLATAATDICEKAAAAADKTVSRYLLDLWRAADPDRHTLALTAAEQEESRDGAREVRAFARAFRRELPGDSGLSLLAAVSVLARERGG